MLRIAITETKNAYADMPARMEDLSQLAGRLDAVRRANVEHNVALMVAAASRGVQVMGLGEMCTGPYFALHQDPMWHAMAEDAVTGPSVATFQAAAKRLSMVLVAPIYEWNAEKQRRYNTAVVIDDAGEILGHYRKCHIPGGSNEQGTFLEPYYFGAADDDAHHFPVFETRHGRIGVSICYDRHFEGVHRSLAAAGAELVFCPAVTFGAKSERMWAMEFEVDAARHNLYIAGSNRRGTEAPFTQPYFGESYVAGPNGRADADRRVPGLVIADVDLASLRKPDPSGWKLGRDRRPSIYTP